MKIPVDRASIKMRVNDYGPGWRDRLGHWLRRKADAIDGRASFAYYLNCQPPLPDRRVNEVFRASFKFQLSMLQSQMEEAAFERWYRVVAPGLFEKETDDE